MKVYLNGRLVPQRDAKISIFDHGLLYGDGVFESFRTYNNKTYKLDEHIKRLLRSAKTIYLRPLPTARQIKLAVFKSLRANNFKEAYIKIIITRGEAKGHGLSLKNALGKPNLIVIVEKQKDYPNNTFTKGWKAIISSIQRANTPSTRIKSLNYLDNTLAMLEAKKAGASEAFLLDEKGHIVEGIISNIFVVKHETIYTPPKEAPILVGITRNTVIKIAKQSAFSVIEKNLTPKELYTADECFITFSGAGIIPITKIWNKKIGSGRCGYFTTSLINLYNAQTKKI